jgi:hypothetical protein
MAWPTGSGTISGRPSFAGACRLAEVYVDAEEIQRLTDRLHIPVVEYRHVGSEQRQGVLGIPTEKHGIGPPCIVPAGPVGDGEHGLPCGLDVLRAFGRRRVDQPYGCKAYSGLCSGVAADHLYGLAVGKQGVVRGEQHPAELQFISGCVKPELVPEADEALRLVECYPVSDPVGEPVGYNSGIFGKPFGAIRLSQPPRL